MTQGEFEKIYLGLRKNLMQRSIYKFKIDKDKFIDDCIFRLISLYCSRRQRMNTRLKRVEQNLIDRRCL